MSAPPWSEPRGMQPLDILGEGTTTAISQGVAISWEAMGLWQELMRIAVGPSDIAPAEGDRRFADPAWSQNPAYHRLGQSYLAFNAFLRRLVDILDSDPANWRQAENARFAVNLLISSLDPTNALLTNPAALKRAFDTGGQSLLDPDGWLGTAEERPRTWWPEWGDWGIGHSGSQRPSPEQPGSALYPPLDSVPGRYATDGGPQ